MITRERPKIDRIACPWLIVRFIDPAPNSSMFRPPDACASRRRAAATPYDVPG